jgi:predicted ABC-type transport system involved in lysophospholipase L1 biosynthesis ATPase subunit
MMVVVTHSPALAARFDRRLELSNRTLAPAGS